MYRQDGAVESPDKPVKPKKLIIIALGAIGGLVLGGAVGLIRHLGFSMRKRDAEGRFL
ncbi:hypothetical protein D3C77_617430 [compost metagenome]